MKKITSTVKYTVPHWNFCNIDRIGIDGSVSKDTCNFCIKTKLGHECLLHNESLSVNNGYISKTRECCKATAGYGITVDTSPQTVTVDPKELIKQTIDLYNKTVNQLLNQGYPRAIAEATAKTHILGGNRL